MTEQKRPSAYNVVRAPSKKDLMRSGEVVAECYTPQEAAIAFDQAVKNYPGEYVCIMSMELFGGGITRDNQA